MVKIVVKKYNKDKSGAIPISSHLNQQPFQPAAIPDSSQLNYLSKLLPKNAFLNIALVKNFSFLHQNFPHQNFLHLEKLFFNNIF